MYAQATNHSSALSACEELGPALFPCAALQLWQCARSVFTEEDREAQSDLEKISGGPQAEYTTASLPGARGLRFPRLALSTG